VRAEVAVLVVALNDTVPLPLPLLPLVTVSQPVAALLADHTQPAAAVTPIDPVVAAAPTVALVADRVGVHVGVNEKGFERELVDVPPGPMAATRASYCCPAASGLGRRLRNGTRIKPSPCGAGLPRFADCNSCELPAGKICKAYEVTSGLPFAPFAL
jgi:hypothetical protein